MYAANDIPWDAGEPEPLLVELVTSGGVAASRALDIGSGTGTDAVWLAERGFDVLGVDISPLAVERARHKLTGSGRCRFATLDFLAGEPLGERFDFAFDRGCFHGFESAEERARFVARVAAALSPGGLWLTLCASADGPPREPPRRSAFDLVTAIEPVLEIVELRSVTRKAGLKAWFCLSRVRAAHVPG